MLIDMNRPQLNLHQNHGMYPHPAVSKILHDLRRVPRSRSHWRAAPSALLGPLQSSRAAVTRIIDDRVRLPCRRVAVHVDHVRVVLTICEAALCDRDAAMLIDAACAWPHESIALRLCTHPPTHPPHDTVVHI
jgi:hypothetical protein